ncbi:S66 peptidase family protein [Vulgatibacter incomptus]|uniref:Muramoyltetrapeptide carboxypeptidase n=1 Tax=Vulgatibacter incomptus TaxID=1391653 RepID=A0A0K1PH90_9BACT|nr:LD-carboxypeptidase [Vulgatibacter incomptus]AKU92489.1 Muramoyltetrapeptide carboxypeptidase [Vulgatibacter incomptus]
MLPTKPVRPGDLLAIVAPSGPYPEERYAKGLAVLRERGFRVKELLPPRPWRYLAAEDRERSAALSEAFADPEVRAIFAARGGYGAMRLLPSIDWAAAARSGKAFVGFSDATAIHLTLQDRGARSVHGPVITQLGEQPQEAVDRLFALLGSDGAPPPIAGRTVVPGTARGRLVGGCLSLVSRLVGTPYFPSLAGCILLLEDVGERPYRLDRMWTHLSLTGVLDELAGVAIGDLTSCDEPGAGFTAAQVLEELAASSGKPVISGLPIGHGDVNLAVPLGAMAEIRDGSLRFEEGLL